LSRDSHLDCRAAFSDLDLQQAIELRWTLRDIKAKRWLLSSINSAHLQTLIAMGLVEIENNYPVLTNSGLDVIS
jgi:DNA-binding MarR family transcriptional regulator